MDSIAIPLNIQDSFAGIIKQFPDITNSFSLMSINVTINTEVTPIEIIPNSNQPTIYKPTVTNSFTRNQITDLNNLFGFVNPTSTDGFETGTDTATSTTSKTYDENGIKYLEITKISIELGYLFNPSIIIPSNALNGIIPNIVAWEIITVVFCIIILIVIIVTIINSTTQ
jgi:hypothetical protein